MYVKYVFTKEGARAVVAQWIRLQHKFIVSLCTGTQPFDFEKKIVWFATDTSQSSVKENIVRKTAHRLDVGYCVKWRGNSTP